MKTIDIDLVREPDGELSLFVSSPFDGSKEYHNGYKLERTFRHENAESLIKEIKLHMAANAKSPST